MISFDRILEYLSEWLPATLRRVPRYLGVVADTTIADTDQFHQFKGLADEIVILSRAPQQLSYPMVSPVLEDDIPATLAAVSAARRWAPLVQWTFAGVDQLSSSASEIRRILTTPPSPIAQQHASLALPMSIDFRRG